MRRNDNYKPDMTAVTSIEGRTEKRLGNGDAKVKGLQIEGTVRWDIYEKDGGVTGENRSLINIAGHIYCERWVGILTSI